jgi:putative transposase
MCGFDAHTCVKGRKRHILVDTLGLLLAVYVTPADLHDGKGARCLLAGLAPLHLRLPQDLADAACRGQELAAWWQAEGGWERACGRAHARHTRLQYFTQTVGGGANTELDFP